MVTIRLEYGSGRVIEITGWIAFAILAGVVIGVAYLLFR
jgi:hypothetical protein